MKIKQKKFPLVSVIVPTKNSSKYLNSCLQSIKNQTYKNIELIVVDNHSSDNTGGIAKKYTKKLFIKGPERSVQRNWGVTKSSGDYISWIDSDMELDNSIIEQCIKLITDHPEIQSIILPERAVGNGYWAKCRALEMKCYLNDTDIEGVRFMKKDLYKQIGGLNSGFIAGEDWDITHRIRTSGYKIGRVRAFVRHHQDDLKLLDDLKKKYYYATKSHPYINKHVKSSKDIIKFIFRPAFIKNWRLILADPIHGFGMLFMKASEFFVGAIGIIRSRSSNPLL